MSNAHHIEQLPQSYGNHRYVIALRSEGGAISYYCRAEWPFLNPVRNYHADPARATRFLSAEDARTIALVDLNHDIIILD